jgi:DNA polymerase IV
MFVPSGATILHADLDSFYASVEQRDDPLLRGRPVIVGAGVVLAASYEAKAYGVRTAMSGGQARRLCPHAVVVPPRMSVYSKASDAVFDVFRDTTPLVEPLSVDEAFLDVSGLLRYRTPVTIAAKLRADVRERVGLPITVGIARTKFLAKVASQVAKPDGLLLVAPDRELEFLQPLPVRRLWGVGAVTADKLRTHGVETVADVAELGEPMLASLVGAAMGHRLYALSHDAGAVGPATSSAGAVRSATSNAGAVRSATSNAGAVRSATSNSAGRHLQNRAHRRSVGAQRALGRAHHSNIDATIITLVDRITRRMRTAGRTGRTVVLRMRFDDFGRATRSHTLPGATSSTEPILAAARGLVSAAAPLIAERGLTMIGFSVTNIDRHGAQQLELPFDSSVDALALDAVIDRVRQRYGTRAVTQAVLLNRDPGLEMPHLPD